MVIASKFMSITTLFISLIIGFISNYIISDLSKEQKKKNTEEMVSQLINFIIFIFISKIILNLPLFISDPLVVLAYPSDSGAFYLAILFSALLLIYKDVRKKMDLLIFIESSIPVFLITSFVYEFIQFVLNDNTYSFGYLILLAVLLVLYYLITERITTSTLIILMIIGWSAGMFLLAFIQPFATVFGYIMAPWFIVVFLIISLSYIMIKKRKKRLSAMVK